MAAHGLWTLLLAGACACAVPGTARASSSAAAPEPAVRTTTTVTPRSYQPKPKETLDQVIGHTLPGSPLRIELLRQAFVSQNPQAFVPGKIPKLRKGVPLTVPDHEELLRMHLGVRAAPVVEPGQTPRLTPSTAEERKHWVQFP